jgi:hypothetical protein
VAELPFSGESSPGWYSRTPANSTPGPLRRDANQTLRRTWSDARRGVVLTRRQMTASLVRRSV